MNLYVKKYALSNGKPIYASEEDRGWTSYFPLTLLVFLYTRKTFPGRLFFIFLNIF